MSRLVSVLLAFLMLLGCQLPTFPERPTPIDNSFSLQKRAGNQVIWLWLPQTMQSELVNYRLAVDSNLSILVKDKLLLKRSLEVQKRFEQAVKEHGGVFEPSSGKLNQTGLMAGLDLVKTYVAAEMPEVTDIIYVNLKQQSVKVQDGVARWNNTQQKVANTNSSVRYTTAVSLELRYISSQQQPLTEIQGLDIQPAPLGNHNRYELILKRVLQPYL